MKNSQLNQAKHKSFQIRTISESEQSKYVDLPNPGLRAYFSRVKTGSNEEYRTTFYKGRSLESILSGWTDTLSKISHDWPTLMEFENDLKSKVGPLSIMKPLAERIPDVEAYYTSINKKSAPMDDRAITALLNEFGAASGLRIRSLDNTIEAMKKSTSSGLPYFRKRSTVIEQNKRLAIDYLHGDPEYQFCAILGWRGQEGGPDFDDVKQRVVWMFPFSLNILELSVYQPLIIACQKHDLVPAWIGMDRVDERITKMFDTKGADDLVICTDFSKFDQHFNYQCQSVAATALENLFGHSDKMKEWLEKVFYVKYSIPMMIQSNEIVEGPHGMASGSGGTNADETLFHRALQHEAALLNGSKLNPNSQCLGDDGVLTYPGCTVEDVVRVYSSHGQDMNKDKQYASKHTCVYLRRWHHKDYRQRGICVGVYSTYRALGKLAEQERYYDPDTWSKEMVALRQLSIIENCKYHPLFEEFVDYCMKGDKFRLGLDIPGFFEHINRWVQKANEYMPDFLGYTKSLQGEGDPKTGIKDWAVVKYLTEKYK